MKNRRTHLVFAEEAEKYGSVFRWYLGNQMFVVLSGSDIINEALVKKAKVFSDRPVRQNSIFAADENGIVFNQYGECWRQLRRFTLHSLRDFGVGKASTEQKVMAEIEVVSDILQACQVKPIAVSSLLQKLVANIIQGIIFGKRYDYDDPKFDRVINLSSVLNSASPTSASSFMPKFLAKLISKKDVDIDERKKETLADMRRYVFEQIQEHIATFDADNIRDFLDIYIQTSREQKDKKDDFINERNLFRVIVDLFVAGTETTTTTLEWAFLYLAEFPDVQKRCQQEIETVFGDKAVEYSERNRLIYVNAFILEVHRHCCLVPLNLPHCANQETTLAGYDIPKGTVVFPTLYSVNMDPNLFKQPEKFDPERFIDSTGKLKSDLQIIPFSTGPRTCLGEALAKTEMFLVIVNLLQKFNFTRENPDQPHGLVCDTTKSLNAPVPYKLRVCKRQSC